MAEGRTTQREAENSRRRDRYRTDPAYRAKVRAEQAESRRRHRDARRAKDAAYYEANRERILDRQRTYLRDPLVRLRRRERDRARRAVERAGGGPIDPAVIYERDRGICGICGAWADPRMYELDHVIPIARGGAHTETNVQVAHPDCNRRKGARLNG